MPTRLALIALATVLLAACSGGPGTTTQPTVPATAAPTLTPTQTVTEVPATAAATVNPILVSSFCEPFASEVLTAWPPLDAAAAGDLEFLFRAWSQNPNLTAVSDDMLAVLTWLAVARLTGTFSPTTTAAEAFGRIEAFAAENC